MAIYLFGCSKGGVGKTTLTTNVAVHLALLHKHRVCIVDADEQSHSNGWCVQRLMNAPDAPRVSCRVMAGSVAGPVRSLLTEYDDVLVDAGGKDLQELRSAMRVADIICMPFAAGQFDLWAVEVMDELLSTAREYNPKLGALALINKAETNWVRSKSARAARDFIHSFPSMRCAQTTLHLRTAPYYAASESGLSVFELGRGADKAATEVANLMQEVADEMGGESGADKTTDEISGRVGERGPGGRQTFEA